MLNLFKNNPVFLLAIALKIVILGFFSSEYMTGLFMPFIGIFVQGHLNPWEYYITHGLNPDAFPYHALMLYLLSPFYALGHMLGTPFWETLFTKIPLLIFDIVIYQILLNMLPNKRKGINMIYFLNPIIFYSIYIHSQLDIIPTAILMASIYCVYKKKLPLAAVLIGLSLGAKTHILVALPLILIFIYKVYSLRSAFTFVVIALGVFLLIDSPFLFSDGFRQMVLSNSKQSLLFDSYYGMGKLKILLPVLSIVIVYFHFFNQRKANFDLLFFYFGILFTSTIFFIYPSPAWYVWVVPFIAHYFIQNYDDTKYLLLHGALSFVYLAFFVTCYQSDYIDIYFLNHAVDLKFGGESAGNVLFTILEGLLIIIMYGFYKYGIKSNSIYSKQLNLAIGIGGDSGSGKSSLMVNLSKLLQEKLLQIEGDGEHKWERGDKNWDTFTHLDPKANNIHQQASYIIDLKENKAVQRSEYDHNTGKFTVPLTVKPKEFIAISGLHPFYLPKMRKSIDLKIYIDTEEKLRRHWKIVRDMSKRDYTKDRILEQIEGRMQDAVKFIYPQKAFADVVIRYFPLSELTEGDKTEPELGLRITLDANIHLEYILGKLDCIKEWDYHQDLNYQYIELHRQPDTDFKTLARDTIFNIEEITSTESEWLKGYDGFIQFVILLMISEKLKKGKHEV